jgi:hypothetical protein
MDKVDKILKKWQEQNDEINKMIADLKKQMNSKNKISVSK